MGSSWAPNATQGRVEHPSALWPWPADRQFRNLLRSLTTTLWRAVRPATQITQREGTPQ